jgi:hypothetical protein
VVVVDDRVSRESEVHRLPDPCQPLVTQLCQFMLCEHQTSSAGSLIAAETFLPLTLPSNCYRFHTHNVEVRVTPDRAHDCEVRRCSVYVEPLDTREMIRVTVALENNFHWFSSR